MMVVMTIRKPKDNYMGMGYNYYWWSTCNNIYSLLSKFISTHSSEDAKSVASGEIGLGSLSGSVGGIKTYSQTTITNANIAPSNNNVFLGIESLYTGIVGGIVLILGLL